MKVYVEAYYADNTPILGNGDGQMVWDGLRYKATHWYRNLRFRNTIKPVANNIIRDAHGFELERVKHELPKK